MEGNLNTAIVPPHRGGVGIASPTPVSFDHLVGARKALGLEGIVSKRLDKRYSPGRCYHWKKVKNPSYVRP